MRRQLSQAGSIAAGRGTDHIVLDRTILAVDPHDIHKAKVELGMMNGAVWHKA